MNILLFVMTFLMLMTIMTYARLDTFRSFNIVKIQFESYMKKYEREFPNLRQVKWYEQTHVTKKAMEDSKKEGEGKSTSRLSFYPLLKKNPSDKDKRKSEESILIAKELIKVLYSDQKFYKDLLLTRPNFLDELFIAIPKAVQELPDKQGINKISELANLDLKDPVLNELFYKILKGSRDDSIEERETQKVIHQTDEESEDYESFDTNDGYLSLLDFINLSHRTQIKIYLASKPLLMALYGDIGIVDEIVKMRKNLYSEIMAKRLEIKDASKTFNKEFSTRLSLVLDSDFLDFSVSKTDPTGYD